MKYRIKQYNPGAWCIEEWRVVPEINQRTGKRNKTFGASWVEIKYPGTLAQAADLLLSLVIGTEQEHSIHELTGAVRAAEKSIKECVANYVAIKKDGE